MITATLIGAAVSGMVLAVSEPASAAVPRHVLSAGDGSVSYAKYRPHAVDFVQDGTLWLTGTHWSRWTATRAVGHGVAHVNNCDPYCAAGSIANVPARIVESHPVTVCGRRVFSRYELCPRSFESPRSC
jgi:hypothetical protein